MSVVYDAGALIAAERSDRVVWADHRARLEAGVMPATTAPVAAQVSRSSQQVQLRRFLRGCDVLPFTPGDAHEVGRLLARAATADVVDAHVVLVASRRARPILTSDPHDLTMLSQELAARPEVRTLQP
ncbi:MAG: twitching motility protein PilT [Actinomycetota bacterium]|nr:twitching motility protein PilT [Actinomycetota bacterium]